MRSLRLRRPVVSALAFAVVSVCCASSGENSTTLGRGDVCWLGVKPNSLDCKDVNTYLQSDVVLLIQIDGENPRTSNVNFDAAWYRGGTTPIAPGEHTLTVSTHTMSHVGLERLDLDYLNETLKFMAEAGHSYEVRKLYNYQRSRGRRKVPPDPPPPPPRGETKSFCGCTYAVFDVTSKTAYQIVGASKRPN